MIPEGAVVRVWAGNKPNRTGVVLRRLTRDGQDMLYVPWGTGTDRPDLKSVKVEPQTAYGVALELEKVTYFYTGNVVVYPEAKVELRRTSCPPGLLVQLKALYGL